jgi:hypothetical protein
VVGIFVLGSSRKPAPSTVDETAGKTAPPAAPLATPASSALALTKAAIKIPAAAVLTFRSNAGGAKTYLTDLAAALEPYRKDHYLDAAHALAALSRKYPDAAEPAYYEGVCQLFLNQNEAAIESLESARRYASKTLSDDVSWYLAVGFEQAGRPVDARREAEALCMRAGEYQARACAAADQLKAR